MAKKATSSIGSFLMHGAAKLVDIKGYPDLGGTPEKIDATSLSDYAEWGVPGVEKQDSLVFLSNYTPEEFKALKLLEGKVEEYAVWFGADKVAGIATPTGDDGKFTFSGELSVRAMGADVNAIRNMETTITLSTGIVFSQTP